MGPDSTNHGKAYNHALSSSKRACKLEGKDREIETLRILLVHWIERTNAHEEGFREWAEKTKDLGKDETSLFIEKAAKALKQASEALFEAKKFM